MGWKASTMGKVEKSAKAEKAEAAKAERAAKAEKKQAARAVKAEKHFAMVDMEAEKQIAMVNMGSDRMPSTEMQGTSVWDADDLAEIVSQIELERSLMVDFYKRKADIAEGCKHCCINFFFPWRWIDMQNNYNSIHLAVTAHHLLYIEESWSVHSPLLCPPCCCCCESCHQENFAPKTRKSIPLEKITDVEVQEEGSNVLVRPGCCGESCNLVSVQIPFSVSSINTAGLSTVEMVIEGIRDPKAFRKLVMAQKRGGHADGTRAARRLRRGDPLARGHCSKQPGHTKGAQGSVRDSDLHLSVLPMRGSDLV